jgi:ADP-ribosylglycohydrolase
MSIHCCNITNHEKSALYIEDRNQTSLLEKIKMIKTHPLDRCRVSLTGFLVGDAIGDRFAVHPGLAGSLVKARALPSPPWYFTCNTQMALSIASALKQANPIDLVALAQSFTDNYDPHRERSLNAIKQLETLTVEEDLGREMVKEILSIRDPYGNSAAARAALIGAYFADSIDPAIEQTKLAGAAVYLHPEAIAASIAVVSAASWAWQFRQEARIPSRKSFLELIVASVPESNVRDKLINSMKHKDEGSDQSATDSFLENSVVSDENIVPFALWVVAGSLENYEDAIWQALSGMGDCATTCAIVGSIVTLYSGVESIPADWMVNCEGLPEWPFLDPDQLQESTTTLYRPVGPKELALIVQSDYRAFPPRLPEQPIFYPVTNEEYAAQIARDWNVSASGVGFVTRFAVRSAFLSRYSVRTVGRAVCQEYWIPAKNLAECNENIVGKIEVIGEYR